MKSLYRSLTSHMARIAAVIAIMVALPVSGSFAAIAYSHHAVAPHVTTGSHSTSAVTGRAYFSLNSQWSTTAQNDRLAAINTAAATGFLDVYTGTQPANGNSTVTGTLLCSFALGSTAFHAPSSGTMGNNGALTCTAGNTGTAVYTVLFASNHTTVLWMGSVGTSSANLTLVTTSITSGVILTLADAAFVLSDVAAPSGL